MISEERIKDLWLYRDNIHDGNLVAQLCDFARAIEAEVVRLHTLSACEACIEIPAVGEYIKQLEHEKLDWQKEFGEDREDLKKLEKQLATANALIEQARKTLEYHCDQTRPIQRTTATLTALEQYQKGAQP